MAETKITKRQFDAAYNKHLPSGWIKFAYKYFSKSTQKENMSLNNTIVFILIGLFLVGFFGTAFNAPREIVKWVTIGYSLILSILVLYLLSAVFLNNRRLKKVMKILGVTKIEYNKLVKKFYP